MYCIQCNKQLKDGSKFCSFCGTVQSADNGFTKGEDGGFGGKADSGLSKKADRGFSKSVNDSFDWMEDMPSASSGNSHSFMDETIADSSSPYNVVVKKNLKNNKKSKSSKNSKNKKTESSEREKKTLGIIIAVLSALIFIVLIVGIIFVLSQYTDVFDGLRSGSSDTADTSTVVDTGDPDTSSTGGEDEGKAENPSGGGIPGTASGGGTGVSALDDVYDTDRITDEYGVIGSLNIETESTNASEDKASKVASDWIQVKRNGVLVYSEGSDISEIIGEVNSGFTAKYYDDEGDFAHIKYHGRDGYILKVDTDGASRRQVTKTIETYIRYKDILDLFLLGPENAQNQYNRPWVEFHNVDMRAFERGICMFALFDIDSDGIEELIVGDNSFNGDMKDNGTPYYVNGYMAGAAVNSNVLYEEINPYNVNKVLSY